MRVIGTAGHVDHGKSTLIAALTGTHPDRLKEEQEREMTIELGFGWMILPDGQEIGIVDVPGHRDFIENMLAGVGGIDAALLVIAADEGVMPQTREHLAILDLLQIQRGLVIISKVDMVTDPDWLDLVENDIHIALAGTVMETAQTLRVSAKTGLGLDELKQALSDLLRDSPSRLDLGRPRLPIDRVFSIAGFGTVVTGTLSDGHLALGDEIEVLPSALKGRVRGLQTHKKKEDNSIPGSRTALNISGIAVDEITRGEVLVTPGHYQPVRRFDARLRLLKDLSAPLKHNAEVKIFVGTAETVANVRILGAESLAPGDEGWIQFELRDPLVLVRGDRFILRRPSPAETLGGGQVVDPNPKQRHKRFDESVLKGLEALSKGSPAEVLFQAALSLGAAAVREIVAKARLEPGQAQQSLDECLRSGLLVALESPRPVPDSESAPISARSDELVIPAPLWFRLKEDILAALAAFHKNMPLKRGMSREELKSRLKLSPRLLNAALKWLEVKDGALVSNQAWLSLPGHAIRFSPTQQAKVATLLKKFADAPYAPPSIKECQAEVGEDVFGALLELGELSLVSPEVAFRRADYERMTARVRETITQNGQVTAGEVRDLFGTSRKFALALLEHMDAIGVTIRDGDFRRLRR
jgi:selenocysteine-specific elongation factor